MLSTLGGVECGREVLIIAERLLLGVSCMAIAWVLSLLRLEIILADENGSCLIDYSGWQDVFLRYSARYSLYHYST